jgi:hypothetical protein
MGVSYSRSVGNAAEEEQLMYRPLMRQAFRLGVLVTLFVLALSACGGGGEQEEQEAKGRTLPDAGETLAAGVYTTRWFKPALSFTVDEGWIALTPELQDVIVIGQRDEPLAIGFNSIERVIKPGNLGQKVAAPEDIAAWLQEHPRLDTEEPGRVSVGGVSGQQFDAIAYEPTDNPAYCREPCVPLFVMSNGRAFWLGKSEKFRFIVLDKIEGKTVTIIFGGPAVEFEEFLPEAQKVLDTVEWTS